MSKCLMNLLASIIKYKMWGEIFTCHFCATLQTGDPGWFSAVFSMFSAAVFSWGCSRRDICQKRFIESVLKVKETWWVDPGSEKHDPLETCILFFSCVWLCDCREEAIDYCQIFLLLNSSSIYVLSWGWCLNHESGNMGQKRSCQKPVINPPNRELPARKAGDVVCPEEEQCCAE